MRTSILRGTLAIAVLLTGLALPASAQSLVRGVVLDIAEMPVEGATVVFENVDSAARRDAKTNRRGEFLFQGLPSGEYKITASKEGLAEQSQTIAVKQTENPRLTFYLGPTRPVGPAPAPAEAGLEAISEGVKPPDAKDEEAAALKTLASAAMDAYQSKRYDESVTRLTELTAKLPTCADCYLYLGNSHIELKQFEEAEAALKKSVEISPSVEGYTALTRFYNSQRKFDLAAEASQKATELASTPAPAATAATTGEAAAPAGPAPTGNSDTLYNQGVVLWNAGKYAEAKVQFEAAVKSNPENADALYQLGMANLNLGQIGEARSSFEQYLKVAPSGDKAAQVKTFLEQLPK